MATTVLLPGGLLAPDPSRETYPVTPGGATEVKLAGDDRIRIIDRHGGQVAMLTGGLDALGLTKDRDSDSVRLFGPQSPPGEQVELVADRNAVLRIAAPGGRIVDGDPPATELLLEIRRATPRRPEEVELPEPLAEPRLDFRIDAAT